MIPSEIIDKVLHSVQCEIRFGKHKISFSNVSVFHVRPHNKLFSVQVRVLVDIMKIFHFRILFWYFADVQTSY